MKKIMREKKARRPRGIEKGEKEKVINYVSNSSIKVYTRFFP